MSSDSPHPALPPLKSSDIKAALRLEGRCLNAWPALREETLAGWRLRFGSGFTRRANSVQPLGAVERGLSVAVDACESAYRAVGQPCVFKLSPLAQPPNLDAALEARGYRLEGLTSVQGLDAFPSIGNAGIQDETRLLPAEKVEWLEGFFCLDDTPPCHHATMAEILGKVASNAALQQSGAGVILNERLVACGRAVVEDEFVGLFDIATDVEMRGRGLASGIIAALLTWGREQGANRAYLQVETDNLPALRLYHRLGFRECYRYAYRVLDI